MRQAPKRLKTGTSRAGFSEVRDSPKAEKVQKQGRESANRALVIVL